MGFGPETLQYYPTITLARTSVIQKHNRLPHSHDFILYIHPTSLHMNVNTLTQANANFVACTAPRHETKQDTKTPTHTCVPKRTETEPQNELPRKRNAVASKQRGKR